MNQRTPQTGDVFQLKTERGYAYLQTTHVIDIAHVIRVLPGLFSSRPSNLDEVVSGPERFFALYPVDLALADGSVQFVGSFPVPPGRREFPILRRDIRHPETGRVLEWHLWDGSRTWTRPHLSEEERHYSLNEVWVSDEVLAERIASGWSPTDVTEDPPAGWDEEEPDSGGEIEHFLYFPTEGAAHAAADALVKDGYQVEVVKDPSEESWTLIARPDPDSPAAELDLETASDQLETIAASGGGYYDGHGVALGPEP